MKEKLTSPVRGMFQQGKYPLWHCLQCKASRHSASEMLEHVLSGHRETRKPSLREIPAIKIRRFKNGYELP